MSKSIRYFALKEDLMEIINYIDSEFNFKYVKNGAYDCESDISIYNSLSEYENIGFNQCGNHQNEFFLVLPANKDSLNIMNNLEKIFRKFFLNHKGYYIGKRAFKNKNDYRFITMNIYEPIGYDFKF